ncbi:MAG TPA: hypothetical protein VGN14_16530 [Candidatus Elarobacter sp.]|jgi:hypothetical protein
MFSPLAAPALAVLLFAQVASGDEVRHAGATPPPHGYPTIESVSISSTSIRAGSRVTGSVVTSTNVGYVEARIQNYNVAMHEDAPGHFSGAYTIPWWLPPWLRHGYTLQIIARSVDGVEAVRGIGISVR